MVATGVRSNLKKLGTLINVSRFKARHLAMMEAAPTSQPKVVTLWPLLDGPLELAPQWSWAHSRASPTQ